MNFMVVTPRDHGSGERGGRRFVRGQAAKAAGPLPSNGPSLFSLFDRGQKRIGCTRRSSEGIGIAGGQVLKF